MPAPRRTGEKLVLRRRAVGRRSCGPRSCSDRRTTSSTVRRHGALRCRRCRWSAAGIPGSSRSSSATSPAAVVAAVEGRARDGQIYELGGPEVKSFKELMQFVLATIGRRRLLLPIPFALAEFQAFVPAAHAEAAADAGPGRALAQRQRRVGSGEARRPHARSARHRPDSPWPAIVPSYLWRFRKTGQFQGTVVGNP